MTSNYINLSYTQVALASLLIFLNAFISLLLKLQLGRRLLIASVRMVIQLLLVGVLLNWVFSLQQWYSVIPLMIAMSLIAGVAAVQRTTRRYPHVWINSVLSVVASSWALILLTLLAVIRPHPWYSPQYAISLMGMLLGNSLTGISLGLERFEEELVTHRDQIETLLALGATRAEAARLPVRTSITTGLIPIINVMVVVGIVSLPGTMTGQLLAGVDPLAVVKYQIVILFLLVSATTLGTVAVVMLSFWRLFNSRDQFQYGLITTRGKGALSNLLVS